MIRVRGVTGKYNTALHGYPPTLGGKYPSTRVYLRPYWAGTRLAAVYLFNTGIPAEQPGTRVRGTHILEHDVLVVLVPVAATY